MALAEILAQLPPPFSTITPWAFILLVTWMLVWKGLALWKAARLNQPVWFIIILLVNTLGILEILYIFVFARFAFNHLKMRK